MWLKKITIHNLIYSEKKIWKKIHRGDPYLKKPTLGDQRKKSEKNILKKNIFNFFSDFFFIIFFFNPKWDFFKKKSGKILKKILRKSIGGPFPEKPTLGDQRKKSEKKIWKKLFSIFFKDFSFIIFFSISSGTFSKFEASSSIS